MKAFIGGEQKFDPRSFLNNNYLRSALFVVIVYLIVIFLQTPVLMVKPTAGNSLYVFPQNGEWLLSYTHSVQKTTVEECFKLNEDGKLSMYKTLYSSFGVGLPFLASDGQPKLLEDGRMELYLSQPRVFEKVMLWTGDEAKVVLKTGTDTVPLYAKYPSGTLVEISLKSRWHMYASYWGLGRSF